MGKVSKSIKFYKKSEHIYRKSLSIDDLEYGELCVKLATAYFLTN